MAITVTSVNDAPVNTVPGAQTVNEDTALLDQRSAAIAVNDVDGNLPHDAADGAARHADGGGGGATSSRRNGSATLTLSGHAGADQRGAGDA